MGELDQRAKDAALNTELQALDPSLDPVNIENAKSKIESLLDNVQLFEQDPTKEPDVIDEIIQQTDNLKTPEDENIFLRELENVEDAVKDPLPSPPVPSGGTVTFSEPQVSRGDTGVDVIAPIEIPKIDVASIGGGQMGGINPQTMAGLESVGMPLFRAAEGGIVDLYESKKFKKPQVVA